MSCLRKSKIDWPRKTSGETMIEVGSKAPGFTLESDGGQKVSLSDYHGRKVVMFFYPKANTPG